jgi:hypothetical protein
MHCSAEVREEENKQIASANKSRKKEKERRLDLANEPRKFDDRTIMFPLYGNRDVSTLAAFTLKALRRTFQKGDRRMVPSVTELEALGVLSPFSSGQSAFKHQLTPWTPHTANGEDRVPFLHDGRSYLGVLRRRCHHR